MRLRGTIDHLLRYPSFEGMRQDELPSVQARDAVRFDGFWPLR
jgi:hypothetical protein